MKTQYSKSIVLVAGVILATALSRLIMPVLFGHPSNFSPVGAMALFSGAYLGSNWRAFSIPLLSLMISDLFVNYIHIGEFTLFYPGFYWQYGCFALIVLLGSGLIKNVRLLTVVGGSLAASILFFIISNFGVWATGLLYPQTASGLFTCYIMGIPFFGSTIASDLMFSAVLFGGLEAIRYRYPALIPVRTK